MALCCVLGCGTKAYVPTEAPVEIDKDRIADLGNVGQVEVVNDQGDTQAVIVYSHMGLKLQTDYKQVTQQIVNALNAQLASRGGTASGSPKKIGIKATYLHSDNRMGATWISELGFEAQLGNGKKIAKTTSNVNGGTPQAGMNACMLEAVISLLGDPEVRAYLSGASNESPTAGAAPPATHAAQPAASNGSEPAAAATGIQSNQVAPSAAAGSTSVPAPDARSAP